MPANPVTINMTVKQVNMKSATDYDIVLEKVNGNIRGTITFTVLNSIQTAHNYTPGDTLKVTFEPV